MGKISIELDGRELLVLGDSDYTVAHLQPFVGELRVVQTILMADPPRPNGVPTQTEEKDWATRPQIAFFGNETYCLAAHFPTSLFEPMTIETLDRAQAGAHAANASIVSGWRGPQPES